MNAIASLFCGPETRQKRLPRRPFHEEMKCNLPMSTAPKTSFFALGCLLAIAFAIGIPTLFVAGAMWLNAKPEPYDPKKDPDPHIQALLDPQDPQNVPLVADRGVYTVPVLINEALTLDFIVDSGASDVVLPTDTVVTLLRSRTLSRSDFLPGQSVTLADGSTVLSARFMIRSLRVGNNTLTNVPGSVGGSGPTAPLLLGQTFLSRFKSWKMDSEHHQLILVP